MTAADRRKLNKDAGFSLLELLIAVVILAIIVIPLLNLFLSSNRLNIKSRQTLRATTAAQDIMEGLKAYNIHELKTQFDDPASGFYVIDSRLIKGGVAEETSLEVDPSGNPAKGLYVFSMRELNLQGSKFDAKIVVDGTGYMSGTLTHDNGFNDAALADARSIDKNNGTFVETDKIRQAVLASVFNDSSMTTVFRDSAMEATIKNRLEQMGITNTTPEMFLDKAYQDLKDSKKPDGVSFKDSSILFDHISRIITIDLTVDPLNPELDENGRPKVNMVVTEKYVFDLAPGGHVETYGDMGSGVMVNAMPCGKLTRIVEKDKATGADIEKINVNLFYYPLYGSAGKVDNDKIIINNDSGADLNLLIAKLRYEKQIEDPANPGKYVPDMTDPEYLPDAHLMAAENSYHVDVEIKDGSGAAHDIDKFSLKTNLGLNLAGEKFMGSTAVKLPAQFTVNGTHMDLSGSSGMNIFTLDGVRSPMGRDPAPGESTELIYDVEVSVYEEGAAAAGFPDEKRMVVIGGSTTN